jgi:predicted kinase
MHKQRLIVIRGNSGSGKSKVAECVREKIDWKVAIIGQDTLRRSILKEPDKFENTDVIGLIEQTVTYCLDKGYIVILEGILTKLKYKELIVRLFEKAQCKTSAYYIDVSLEETIKRHATKPTANEFGERELRDWYQPEDYLDIPQEIIINEKTTLEESVLLILKG